jgi:UDP-N-acetylglucosamine acyltransferase
MTVHPTALVDPAAVVSPDAEIGPFCVLGPGVRVGAGCRIGPRVAMYGTVVLGRGNVLHPQVTIGKPDGGRIEIGEANVLREFTYIDAAAGAVTKIGSRTVLGTWVGVLSGSTIGDHVRIGAYSVVSERDVVEDGAWIEPQVVLDAGRRVGRGAWIRGMTPVDSDVPPYMCIDGNPFEVRSVDPRHRSPVLEEAVEIAFKSGVAPKDAARKLRELRDPSAEIEALIDHLKAVRPPEAPLE